MIVNNIEDFLIEYVTIMHIFTILVFNINYIVMLIESF